MGKFAIVVVGPAGSGKSTLCHVLSEHYSVMGRTVHVCNFDPAAEDPLPYDGCSIDVRELISLDDAMEGKGLGPNGGLVFCMEYLMTCTPWLHDALGDYSDDFLLVDMPGQIELTSNVPVVPNFVELLRQEGYFVTVVFALDALAATADTGKFVAGCLFSVSSMVCLDCPFINVLTKCDLLPPEFKENQLEHFCLCDFDYMKSSHLPKRSRELVHVLAQVISDFNLVSFRPLDITDTDSIVNLVGVLDDTLQVTEDLEVRDRDEAEDAGQNEAMLEKMGFGGNAE